MQDVLLTAIEAIRIAEGHPMRVRLLDGTELTVRLPSMDEALEMHKQAIASLHHMGIETPETDYAAIQATTKPVRVTVGR